MACSLALVIFNCYDIYDVFVSLMFFFRVASLMLLDMHGKINEVIL